MKQTTKAIVFTVGFILLLTLAYFGYQYLSNQYTPDQISDIQTVETEKQKNNETEMTAPNFTVTDQNGNTVQLSDLLGKPIILNFWATWCGPCKSEMPAFDSMYREYGDQINFVMINLTDGSRDTVEKATQYIEENGYTFPVYFDTEQDAANAYGVYSIPATALLDEHGTLLTGFVGATNETALKRVIETYFGGEES